MAIVVGPPLVTLDLTIGQVENLNPQGQAQSGINTGVTLNTADTGITLSSGGVIKGGQTAFNTGNGFFLGYTGAQYKVSIGDPSGDNLTWDGADLTITADAGTISGDLTVNGNFTVNGTTTTLNTATLDVEDKNITLNYGSGDTSSTANGAGITIQDAVSNTTDASILWNGATDAFDFSNSVNVTGNIVVSGNVDGRDVATDGDKLDNIEALADVTDTTNVTAAGALMDSELTDLTAVKSLDQGVATTDTPTFAGLATSADVTFGDNDKAIFGAGSDLQIYHDGSNSRIQDAGSGNLKLVTDGAAIQLQSATENMIVATPDADVQLYYNGVQKLATTNTGINVTGDATFADNGKAIFGAGSDLQIYHSGSASYITDSGTGNLLIQGTDVRLQNAGATANYLKGTDGAEVSLFYAGGQKLATSSSGIDVTGTATMDGLTVNGVGSVIALSDNVVFNVNVSGGTSKTSTINQRAKSSNGANAETSIVVTGSSGEAVSAWDFKLDTANGALTKAMTIDGSGDISFYEDTGTTAKFFWDSSAESLGIGTSSPNAPLEVSGAATTSTDIAHFSNSNGVQKAVIGVDAQGDGQITLIDAGNNTDVLFTAGGVSYINTGGNFGLGTSSPANLLDVSGAQGSGGISARVLNTNATSATTYAELKLETGLSTGAIREYSGSGSAGYMAFHNEGTERMRIDSSGNVLVGKTSSNYTIAGAELRDHGTVGGTTTTQTPFFANRTTDDGALFEFYRGTGTVGSIQTFGGNLQISPATTFGVDAPTDIFLDSAGVTTFKTNGTENARIDASGNVLIGTTETDIGFTASGDGCMLAPEGTLQLARDSANELLYLNKLGGNDGDIIRLSTDGNEIGVLGVRANYIKIGNGDTQLLFNSGSDAITPEGLTANRDAAIDLGRTVSRFKDLYLSGGVRGTSTIDITIPETSGGAINLEFGNNTNTTRRTVQAYKDNFEPATADTGVISLGQAGNQWKNLYLSGGVVFGATSGNVSSKTLDDYEEGTFTGAVADASSGGNESSSALRGTYVKIGAVVYVQFNVSNISTTGMTAGNDVFITGLPFATKSVSGTAKYTGTANLSVVTFEQTPFMQVNEGQTYVKILEVRSGAGNDAVVVSQLSSGASDIHGNLVYETA